MSGVCHAFASVHCYLVVTCWERAYFLALVCDLNCVFVTFPSVILLSAHPASFAHKFLCQRVPGCNSISDLSFKIVFGTLVAELRL